MSHLLPVRAVRPAAALPPERSPGDAADYLTDESRLRGAAARLFFPRAEEEVAAVLAAAVTAGEPVTISGGRTGITGGAVPAGGWLMSLERLNRILALREEPGGGGFRLRCQSGVTLETVQAALARRQFADAPGWDGESRAALERLRVGGAWWFPPDPTERSATLGGMVACNASGARTLHYGPTRGYVVRLRALLAGGGALDLERGAAAAAPDGGFGLVLPDGTVRQGRIPPYPVPAVKNAAGYYSRPGMDLLDLLIGSEGTLAVATEMDLRLVAAPDLVLGVIGFFGGEADVLRFVRAARGDALPSAGFPVLPVRPLALEYFDGRALDLLRDQKARQGPAGTIPALPESARAALYVELPVGEADLEPAAESLLALLEACGSRPDTAWTATTPEETERLKAFRHAVPETINQRIGERAQRVPGLTKLGTDFAVPDGALAPMMEAYRNALDAAGLEYAIFGHIGNNHVHANILPRDLDEVARGKALYLDLARRALAWGGTVSAEHGIGKLKKPLLAEMFGAEGLAAMRAVKRVFDPDGRLNPGTMFDP